MKTKLILLAIGTACLLAACGNSATKKDAAANAGDTTSQNVSTTRSSVPISDEPVVELQTSLGNMKLKLYKDTPLHRDNFAKLVNEGYYNGLLFHRVIQGFMIQGGDPESRNATADQRLGNGGPGYNVPAEIVPTHYHKKGVLAAARTNDDVNPNRESSGSQFYIVQGRTYTDEELNAMEAKSGITYTAEQRNVYKTVGGVPRLDGAYTVFGEVIEGLEVLDAIAAQPTNKPGDRPVKDITIVKAVVVE